MPFDAANNVVYGAESLSPLKWARDTFCQWLSTVLNDESGLYAEQLGVTSTRRVYVGDNQRVANSIYNRPNTPPVVYILQGRANQEDFYKKISDVQYQGSRIDVVWTLDMGVKAAANPDPSAEADADELLGAFVTDAIVRGHHDLTALGLCNCHIESDEEMQRAGQGRNPHRVTFFLRTLENYEP